MMKQVSVHALETEGCLVVMKGAPERIIERCTTILLDRDDVELTDTLRATCDKACLTLAEQGKNSCSLFLKRNILL